MLSHWGDPVHFMDWLKDKFVR